MLYVIQVPLIPNNLYDTLQHYRVFYQKQLSWYEAHNQFNTGFINLNTRAYLPVETLMKTPIMSFVMVDNNHIENLLYNIVNFPKKEDHGSNAN